MTETFVPGSSHLDRVTYDNESQEMTVLFKSGHEWIYAGVPYATFHGIQHAGSAGEYFHRNVKGRYTERQI